MAIKRKISEERKQQLRDQLERARAKRKPAEYKNVHPTVLALPEDDNYSFKSVKGWIRESKTGPKNVEPRRGKPPTWYKEHDIPQFDRMITNPNGSVIRGKESEYQKSLDN